MTRLKKLLSIVLAMTLIFTFSISAVASPLNDLGNDLVDVVVYQDDNQSIVACVPRSDLAAFEEELKDPIYRQAQIDMARAAADPSNARVLPEGNILSQQYLGKSDIKEFVDATAGTGTFNDIIGSSIAVSPLMVSQLLSAAGTTAAGIAASIYGVLIAHMLTQQEAWWNVSYRKILNNEISYVRYTIIENPHDYPKIWRVLDRV